MTIIGTWMNMLKIVVFIVAFLLMPCVANAQTTASEALAQSLLDEAVTLMDQKQFKKACPKIEEATKLVPKGIGAKLALAECYVGMDRLASAWWQYVHAEVLATPARDARATEARIAHRKLKPKLATFTIFAPESLRSIEDLSIRLDGQEQGPGAWGTQIPVDIGTHDIEVEAPGRRLWKREVRIKANGEHHEETIQKLEVESNVIARILWEPEFPQWRKAVIGVGTGLTIAGLGFGIGFGVATRRQNDEATAVMEGIQLRRSVNEVVCPIVGRLDPACDELRSLSRTRDMYNQIMTAGLIVGGTALAVTLPLRLISGKNTATKNKHGTFVVVPSLSGIWVTGTF